LALRYFYFCQEGWLFGLEVIAFYTLINLLQVEPIVLSYMTIFVYAVLVIKTASQTN